MNIPEFYNKHKQEILISIVSFRKKLKDNREQFKSIKIINNKTRDVMRIIDERELLNEWRNFCA